MKLCISDHSPLFKPCPFCGSNHIHHESVVSTRYARCQDCSASGGYVFDFQDVAYTKETVVIRWNQRSEGVKND
jgi:Lar family restriction alleviation protein